MTLNLSTLSAEEQVAAIYIGYYERAGDPEGSAFWEARVEGGRSAESVADQFATADETLAVHPFFSDPTEEAAEAFITSVYLHLFGRPPEGPDDVAEGEISGLEHWSGKLLDAINGVEGAISVGSIIVRIINGAQDSEFGNDLTTIRNKIDVATTWTDAAEASGILTVEDYLNDAAAVSSSKTIIEGITDEASTVASAKSTISDFFTPVGVEGETIPLQVGIDFAEGTENDDLFVAQIGQSEFVGGVSNSLATGDSVDGKGGNDRLFANITSEFVGTNLADFTDIHPLIKNVEEIDIRAADDAGGRDLADLAFDIIDFLGGDLLADASADAEALAAFDAFTSLFDGFGDKTIIVDGGVVGGDGVYFNGILGHEEIGSYFSDGDLVIENLTTYDSNGVARNTSEITITMDHTDNFNSDGDASDLAVLFDNDYLLAGESTQGFADFFLLDQDADLQLNNGEAADGRLADIDKNGIQFRIDTNGDGAVDDSDTLIEVSFDGSLLTDNSINTHLEFRNALQDPLQALIADGTLPEGTTIELFEHPDVVQDDQGRNANQAVLDDQSLSDLIPAVRVTMGDGSEIKAEGFSTPDGEVTPFNFFGRVKSEFDADIDPISIDIDLHKVGRGGEGGDLIVGGKAQSTPDDGIADGIEVFNITVKGVGGSGADAKPSSLGTIASTLGALKTINIATDAMVAQGDSFASLEVRDSLGGAETVNANPFLGDLTLGSDDAIVNLHTLTALGGGDVTFFGEINETDIGYSYLTGRGEDFIDVLMDGDALDYNDSELLIDTGAGDDEIFVVFDPDTPEGGATTSTANSNQQLNQAILDNVRINGGADNDTITVDGIGNAKIFGDAGDDIIYTDGSAAFVNRDEGTPGGTNAIWALNFDADRAAANGGVGNSAADDLPGVENTLAYVGGAEITVTLSGAGDFITAGLAAGGGVMAFDIAQDGIDGYEATATVNVAGSLTHYGTQQDINDAVRAAIEGDAVLDALLTVVEGANNTLVIVSKTSGNFIYDDLRIDIAQREVTSLAAAEAVLTEARSTFNNSALTLTDLFGQTTFSADNPGVYEPFAPAGEDGDLTSSFEANDWYNGLSLDGDDFPQLNPSMADNLHTDGFASNAETDNVINGGTGDDIIVLSTDAVAGGSVPYIEGGNNAMINGASNETIVMEGEFGDDTVMNFTTATPQAQAGDITLNVLVADEVSNENGGVETIVTPGTPETLDLTIAAGAATAQPYTLSILGVSIAVPGGSTQAEIAALIEEAFGEGNGTDFTAEVTDTASDPVVVTFTAIENGNIVTADLPTVADNVSGPTNVLAALNFVQADANDVDGANDGSDDVTDTSEEELVVEYFGLPATLGADDQISVTLTGAFPGSPLTIDIDQTDVGFVGGLSGDALATLVAGIIETETGGAVSATVVGNVVTYTADDPGAAANIDVAFTIDHIVQGVFPAADTVAQGLDFLDFGDYLTSEFDSSSNPPGTDSDVSNQLIDVTLDYNEDNTLGGFGLGGVDPEVEANEVAVVRMTDDDAAGETFDTLTEGDVAALFNSGAATADFANLAASGFDVIDNQTDDEVVGGDGKAIFMVEDGDNLGHYRVFELSWDASEEDGDEGVTANEIGSLDFGTSLTDLDEVNLVGSDDYALLNDIGILNFV